ncbi:MAG: hypothetical protein DRJ01_17955 [Bacteroidetes bacterium]|nr:MAG: hypothetical protein DRJ01_17955 [Bacteroidota bacterium]
MKRKKNKINYYYLFFELFFFFASVIIFYFFKHLTFRNYIIYHYKLYLGFFSLWTITAFVGKKFNISRKFRLSQLYLHVFKIDFFNLAIISILVYFLRLSTVSRLVIFGTALIMVISDSFFSLFYFFKHKDTIENDIISFLAKPIKFIKPQYFYVLFDIIIVAFSFLFVIWFKPATVRYYLPNYLFPIVIFEIIWLFISFLGDKYNIKNKKFSELFVSIIRIDFSLLAIASIIIFAFNIFQLSRFVILGTIAVSFIIEIIFSLLFSIHSILRKKTDFSESLVNPIKIIEPVYKKRKQHFEIDNYKISETERSIFSSLKNKYLKSKKKLFNFINNSINLHNIPVTKSEIIETHTLYNIENIDTDSLHLFINLHRVNDIRRINKYFIEINRSLKSGGYFVGCGETIHKRYKKFFQKYPLIIASIFYFFDFVFKRIFPKLPGFKELYFLLTNGEKRVLSKAEILGRLSYCGFNILEVKDIDNLMYFIVRKTDKPRRDIAPSYGPLIKLKRISKDAKIIYVYKLRTMHPYSEYLQQYINDKYHLDETGKFKNDFRITSWGKVFRKMWLDELPQLINLFRGELRLFGVRALSEHYFSLYPKDLQELRIQFKPGLVPPYYSDMPSSFEEILESEKKYLLKKKKHPLKTDIEYFFKAWYNIIFKHARSK